MSSVSISILCLLFHIISPTICGDKTFYIKPTEFSDCHDHGTSALSPCVTLDEFANRELHISPLGKLFPSSFMLIFLPGNHTSCTNIEFTSVDYVTMTGMKSTPDFDVENPPVVINLICSDIEIHSGFNISYLAINGGGSFSIVMRDTKKEPSINLYQIKLISSAVLINSGQNMLVNISRVLFTASKIALNSTFVANISITDSIFLSGNQPQTLAFCHKGLYHYPVSLKPQEFVHVLQVIVDNITISDLPRSDTYLEPPGHVHNSSFCDTNESRLDSSSDFALQLQPSDKVFLRVTIVNVSITNSNFSHSQKNSTAIALELLQGSGIYIANTTISGYTEGGIVSLNHWMFIVFVLYNVTIKGNSLSQPIMEDLEMNAGAGLTIYNYIHELPMYYEISNCVFTNNADYQEKSEIVLLYGMPDIFIQNSTFSNNHGTSISIHESKFSFIDFVEFQNNSAQSGGALALYSSTLKIKMPAKVHFYDNHATKFGGAIYIENPSFDFITNINRPCFYHRDVGWNVSFHIHFENNSAREGGDNIYGAQVGGRCMVNALDHNEISIFTFVPNNTLSTVSSRATRVCLCDSDGSRPQCTDKSKVFVTNRTAYPGETFSINAITVGANLGTTTGTVYAKIMHSSNGSITGRFGESRHHNREFESYQVSSKDHCTTLKFRIHSQSKYEVLYLVSTNASYRREYKDYYYSSVDTAIEEYVTEDTVSTVLLTTPIFIKVNLKDCPPGFSRTGSIPYTYCDCYTELLSYKISCTLQDGVGRITREGDIWIGVDDENEMMFNDRCLSEYCNQESTTVVVGLDQGLAGSDTDSQCAFNHAGVLCGGCQEGYSLSLGSTHCLDCFGSSAYVAVVAFVLGGLILVGIVLLLGLAIGNGGMNGLIFYANIVWAYRALIFPHSDANIDHVLLKVIKYFFRVFIATLNLDVGFELCFWDGMDAFSKSLLQFAFPVYIWIITIAVVVMKCVPRCIHCQRCAKCNCAQWPFKVLVTLILMSYAKLIRTILGVFTFSILKIYPGGHTKLVWGLDGNVPYLRGKHVALFIIALIALLIAFIYTLYISIVGLEHRIFKDGKSSNRVLGKCRKILDTIMPKQLYDAHFAPFKKNHEYWLGLMLFVRAILLLIFSSTLGISPVVNLPILILAITLLLLWMGWKEIYAKKSVWILQGLSLSNLIAISGGILYAELANKEQLKLILVCISVGIAFLQFAGIAVHYVICHNITRCYKKCANRSGSDDVNLHGADEPLLTDQSASDTEPEFHHPPH